MKEGSKKKKKKALRKKLQEGSEALKGGKQAVREGLRAREPELPVEPPQHTQRPRERGFNTVDRMMLRQMEQRSMHGAEREGSEASAGEPVPDV
eukprot:CAMPEP_0195020982 /NCGR_PEP_ID=MMETSP0326_2-20130528/36762_1 /TAXON_ID=2866 ORGANISM="Crypthecodinium cohnii, Strain Seligo" /NCGR_SAMPLE_ID=MMETSP0326_2 /ASSEMBLY_ACC=CAM_ASM_000348 /LENGTH=93 /DNA_ID=CAMNT_0040039943 /DNA_START=238 /DNA_END=517 /DNA_ORIENTATION=-